MWGVPHIVVKGGTFIPNISVNNSEPPKTSQTAIQLSGQNDRGLHLLSIDGGGIRGLSPLLMLKEILYRIQQEKRLQDLPRPCDIFDLAGGTGTGGLIVIMLFRLRMSIDEAIRAYITLTKHDSSAQKGVFNEGNYSTSRLEEAIATVIQEALQIGEVESRSVRMLDEEAAKCFVCAMPVGDFRPSLFRSWSPVADQTYNCTIVEAARATTVIPTFFKPIEFGGQIKQRYIDGGLNCSNPVASVIDEARLLFPSRSISCVISLGTGAANTIGLDRADAFQRQLPVNSIQVLKGIATDSELGSYRTARDAATQSFLYFRLNVDQGLQRVSLTEWESLPEVNLHTLNYLRKHDVQQKVDQLVQVLKAGAPAMDLVPTPPRKVPLTEPVKSSMLIPTGESKGTIPTVEDDRDHVPLVEPRHLSMTITPSESPRPSPTCAGDDDHAPLADPDQLSMTIPIYESQETLSVPASDDRHEPLAESRQLANELQGMSIPKKGDDDDIPSANPRHLSMIIILSKLPPEPCASPSSPDEYIPLADPNQLSVKIPIDDAQGLTSNLIPQIELT